LVSDIPAGDGKTANLFFTVYRHEENEEFNVLSDWSKLEWVADPEIVKEK
jgi:hypothetical protein